MVQICHLDTGRYCGDAGMTSLYELRAWLTLAEAAGYLYSRTGRDIKEDDFLRLALDGQLQLSVNLPQPVTAIQDCGGAELAGHRTQIEGMWDLLVKGPGRLELENRYRAACGLDYVKHNNRDGVFVTREEGVVYQLLSGWKEEGYAPKDTSVFPVGTVLGVRRQVLDAVVASLASSSLDPEEQQPSQPGDTTDPLDRPLGERERTTLLTIIAALALEAEIDISKPSKAGGIIETRTIELDARVSARSIEDHLKRIPEALERRSKTSN